MALLKILLQADLYLKIHDSQYNFIDNKGFVMIFADNIFDMYQNTKKERKGIKSGNCRFIKTGSGNRITGKNR